MSRKIYEAPYTIISNLNVFVGNKPKRINFYPVSQYEGSHTGVGSMFQTEDLALQEALESSPMYGRTFRLFRVEAGENKNVAENGDETTADEKEENVEIVGVGEVATLNDARDYLENRFGIEKKKLPTTKSIINEAQRNGIRFEALDNK